MMDGFEKRTVRLIAFWLRRKINSKGKSVYHYEEDLISSDGEYIIKMQIIFLMSYLDIFLRRKEDISNMVIGHIIMHIWGILRG